MFHKMFIELAAIRTPVATSLLAGSCLSAQPETIGEALERAAINDNSQTFDVLNRTEILDKAMLSKVIEHLRKHLDTSMPHLSHLPYYISAIERRLPTE